jgi:conserved oligomeric Golgi complex subunit 2
MPAPAPAPLSPKRPLSHRTFNLPSDSSSDDEELDTASLPFPTALPRSDFLKPTFSAPDYLSSLSDRHQTLEDLRSDLRERSAAISAELLELVNANYTSFLSLGSELKGGEERVEDVRVGLLGFRRAIEEVKSRVGDRGREVADLSREMADTRAEIQAGRQMLELSDRLEGLEGRLALNPQASGSDSEDSEEDEDEEDEDEDEDESDMVGSSASKLAGLSREYASIEALADAIGRNTPFVRKLEARKTKCRNTLLLDLATAAKEAKKAGTKGQGKLLNLMRIYASLNAQDEAVRTLRAS